MYSEKNTHIAVSDLTKKKNNNKTVSSSMTLHWQKQNPQRFQFAA